VVYKGYNNGSIMGIIIGNIVNDNGYISLDFAMYKGVKDMLMM
jgi:hypothetical protein